MRYVFSFFSRLFFTFLAAKLLATIAGLEGLNPLIVITFLLMGNVYVFDYLDYRSRTAWRRSQSLHRPQPVPAPPREDASEA